VKETGPRDVRNRRPHLLSRMDDINAKSIHRIPSNVIPVDARNQNFPLVVVHEQTTNHFRYFLILFYFIFASEK
jgi:hypothetical protein